MLFIKPQKVYLSVLPKDEVAKRIMLAQVILIQKEYLKNQESIKEIEIPESISMTSFKRIKSLKLNHTAKKSRTLSSDSEDEDFFAKCKQMTQNQNML